MNLDEILKNLEDYISQKIEKEEKWRSEEHTSELQSH